MSTYTRAKSWPFRTVTTALILVVALILGWPGSLHAHTEGKMQLAAVPAGTYQLTAWTSPNPARTGELHVATTVLLAEDAAPVLDAAVWVELAPLAGSGTTLSSPATTEDSSNKFLYEAILEPADAGLYQVSITVTGRDGAAGQASFELEILPAAGFNWLYLIPVGLAAAAFVLLWRARRIPTHPRQAHDTEPTARQGA